MDKSLNSSMLAAILSALAEQQEAERRLKDSLSAFLEDLKAKDFDDEWITPKDAEELTGKNIRQLRILAQKGEIGNKKISDRKTLYRLSDVRKFVPAKPRVSLDMEKALLGICEREKDTDWIPIELASAVSGASMERLKRLVSARLLKVKKGKENKLLFSLQEVQEKAKTLLATRTVEDRGI